MGRQSRRAKGIPAGKPPIGSQRHIARVNLGLQKPDSLLDVMRDGQEYASIVSALPQGLDVVKELQRALADISAARGRPCLAYVGNVANGDSESAILPKDDLPFIEMVESVPADQRKVDIFLATNGGQGATVARFVNALRARFDEVDFLLPSFCMSAGTLFALSGDKIWMTPHACLGPIDPQVPNKDGRMVPAQALLLLVQKLQEDGQKAQVEGKQVPWTAIRIIDTIDKKDLGTAITASGYSGQMALQFLNNYKFKNWTVRRSSNQPVTAEYRLKRAVEVADALVSHEKWKSHGHAISREVLWSEIQLEIDHPDAALDRLMRRAWAVCYWLFDKTPIKKIMVSANYSYITFAPQEVKND